MKPFKVGRVEVIVAFEKAYVKLFSNGHQFQGTIESAGVVDWAVKSFPKALITVLDTTRPGQVPVVVQEAS